MLNQLMILRSNLLRLTVVLSLWLRAYHGVLATTVIVDDGNSALIYQPTTLWFTESETCPRECLTPGGGATYHETIHPPPTDSDDPPSSTTVPSNLQHTSVSSNPATPSQTEKSDGKNDPGNDGDNDEDDGRKRRRSQTLQRRSDFPENVDLTLSFNFTGTAISVFGIHPSGIASNDSDAPPTNTNLTFVLDSVVSQNISTAHNGPLGFTRNSSFFSRNNLEDGPHQLVIHIGQNSSFIFDYLVYETSEATTNTNSSPSPTTSTTPLAESEPSATSDPNRKHDIATFAGAVGGSVGVLALFSLGLAISIIRRRRLSALRDRLDRESLHTNASDDSPHPMSGPAPFVPRFFPDTVIPQDPPTYTTAVATNHNTSTLLAQLNPDELVVNGSGSRSRNRSYADIPPSTPPPPLDEMIPPPPPFPVALNAPRSPPPGLIPVSIIPGATSTTVVVDPELQNLVSNSDSDSSSHSTSLLTSSSVGTTSTVLASEPELVPLLQPIPMPMPMSTTIPPTSLSMMRPLSRISTRSSYDIDGNPIEREDD